MNLWSHQLTASEISTLEKGFNFVPVLRRIPTLKIISCIEAGLRGHKDDTAAGVARARISGILGSAKRPKRNTTKDEEGALTQLTKNEAIVVAEADQGNVSRK